MEIGIRLRCGPVDGMNPVKVAEAMTEAIERARRDGPTFLEMKTYRYRGHSMSDAQLYRSKDEVEE
jgi:pyruvate dehydrogenase E1 component alpha subunit